MAKLLHEIRDPVHGFIFYDNREKGLINSQPFQRLKHIHQLAMTYQVYPGASHKRFEHSLGVMETASRIYNTITDRRLIPDTVLPHVKEQVSDDDQQRKYWRRVVRLAALAHDIGHLPFSHAGEGLLPDGTDHEMIGEQIAEDCAELRGVLAESPPVKTDDVICVAFKHKRTAGGLDPWRTLLNEMITGDFGADRIDYLLRDSHHLGVAYGRFDADRMIDNFRLAIDEEEKLVLAVEIGGLHAAEGLLLARYWMFTQVYYHPVRIAYDLHLADYLRAALSSKLTDWREVLQWNDNRVLQLLDEHSQGGENTVSRCAKRLVCREHFKRVYELRPQHREKEPKILDLLHETLVEEFGEEKVLKYPTKTPKEARPIEFSVIRERTGELSDAAAESNVIATIPPIEVGYILASPEIRDDCEKRIKSMLESVLEGGEVNGDEL